MKFITIYNNSSIDGLMSAGIIKHWFNQQEVPNKEGEPINTIDFICYNHEQPIPDLSKYNKVIMLGVSFPMDIMFDLIKEKGNFNFTYIDNNKITLLEYDKFSTHYDCREALGIRDDKYGISELTWKYFMSNPIEKFGKIEEQNPIPEIVKLIDVYASGRHIGTSEEKKVLEFQYAIRKYITNYKEAYNELLIAISEQSKTRDEVLTTYRFEDIHIEGICIYQYLCKEAKQVYKNGFELELKEQQFYPQGTKKGESILRKFICINKERFNPIDFGIDYYRDGYDGVASFHITNGFEYNFTLYSNTINCNVVAKQYKGNGTRKQAEMILTNKQFCQLID